MKILISCPMGKTFDTFFGEKNIALANSLGECVWNPYNRNLESEEAAELINDCDVYMTVWGAPVLDDKLLSAAPHLALVAHLGGDPRYFVGKEAKRMGVKMISGLRYYNAAAAEGILCYILCALRNVPELSYRLKYKRDWKHSWDICGTLFGKTVGLVNYNGVGAQLARLLASFEVKIYVYSPFPLPKEEIRRCALTQTTLEQVARASDILCVQEPRGGADRYHMINGDIISLIPKGAVLVNTASGGVVDQTALSAALSAGRFFAVLDAYEKEPPEYNDPLFCLSNVIMMPHMAGNVMDIRKKITATLLTESYEYICLGKPLKNEVKLTNTRKRLL